jgi:Zn-dependent protease with chaperone function
MAETKLFETERKRFPGLHPDAFTAETDRLTLEALRRVPILPQVIRKFYDLGMDRWAYTLNMAECIRCGPNQFKTPYAIMREACAILDVPEPELYVRFDPRPNAYTFGVERPYITVHSRLLDAFTDEQLLYLMGHELSHIKAGHVLYMTVANFLLPLLDALGKAMLRLGDAVTIALILAFYEWIRNAELTCDRGGLLTLQECQGTIEAIMVLAGGRSRFSDEMNVDEFMTQARMYQEAGTLEKLAKVIVFLLRTATYTHPQPIFRAQQLEQWFEGEDYKNIMEGDYKRVEEKVAAEA